MSPKTRNTRAKAPARRKKKTESSTLPARVIMKPLVYPVNRPTPRLRNGPRGNTPDKIMPFVKQAERTGHVTKADDTDIDIYAMPSSDTESVAAHPKKREEVSVKGKGKATMLTGDGLSTRGSLLQNTPTVSSSVPTKKSM